MLFCVLHFKSRLYLIRHGCKLQILDSGFLNECSESSEVCITKSPFKKIYFIFFSPKLLHGNALAVRFGSNLEFWFSSIFVSNELKFTAFTACHKPLQLNMCLGKKCRSLGSNWALPNGSQQNCGLEQTPKLHYMITVNTWTCWKLQNKWHFHRNYVSELLK